ncbi:GIY-YIG nuclease family protein [Aeromonas caviae]|uniref:GIY-YIG nuclease family protein n=1 Tax=Aeromonas TaxID=642 RepID=UPI002B471E6A|nr:GIY-YIG nuclease family protein [Aeromonas caviae]
MTNTVTWAGHDFGVYMPKSEWHDKAGIYIFAKIEANGRWRALYIGQASSFSNRLSNHERWAEAVKKGATHIHARVITEQKQRDIIEEQLIKINQPPLNIQLK